MKGFNSSPTTVLAIDHDQVVLDQLSSTLHNAGYHCHLAKDCPAAEEMAGQITPDLIIVDMNLSGHSGLSLCERLKQQPHLADVPVMFLSATQAPDIIRRTHASGTYYYLRKPLDCVVLLQLIERVVLTPHLAGA
jgi:CheY-like chemotaxis protein